MKASVIRSVRAAIAVALLLQFLLLPVSGLAQVTPNTQAMAARQGLNDSILRQIAARNSSLAAQYAETVNQWVWNKQQQKAGTALPPIPMAPASWTAVAHVDTASEALYNRAFPGLPPMIDDVQNGPPVAPQYVEPKAPPVPIPGTVIKVGQLLRSENQNGKSVNLYAALPEDNMPAGYLVPGPGGEILRKVVNATPWGVAQWYQSAQ